MSIRQGQHVTVETDYESFAAIVLEVETDWVKVQQEGTERVERFAAHQIH